MTVSKGPLDRRPSGPRRRRARGAAAVLLALAAATVTGPAAGQTAPGGTSRLQAPETVATTTRVNVADDETQANDGPPAQCPAPPCPVGGASPAISDDGQFVAFESWADNLVPGDTNGQPDVFVRDLNAGTTERVSVAGDGTQANDRSSAPAISGDGRYVAFASHADNLVPDDTNSVSDIFVRDRVQSTTVRVSVTSDGAQGHGHSTAPAISAGGDAVAFESLAADLVADDTNATADVFVRDRSAGTTRRMSVAGDGTQADGASHEPATNGDGSFVTFHSAATDLVADDRNNSVDVFIRDRLADGRGEGETARVSVAGDGTPANGDSTAPAINADAAAVAFQSEATNLVAGDTNGVTDVFVRNRRDVATTRVSVASDNSQATGASYAPAVSADGSVVAFVSAADDLVAGDTNAAADVFVRARAAGTTARVSVADDGSQATGPSDEPAASGNGRSIAFQSGADDLVDDDTNGTADVFVRHRDGAGAVCPPEVPPAPFADREAIPAAHRATVACAAWHDIVAGFADGTYRPAAGVRRDQMASFIVGALTAANVELPAPAQEGFDDVADGAAHAEAIRRLAAADIVTGGPGNLPADAYGPALLVRRDQMASFVLRAAEFALEQDLSSQQQAFDDVGAGNAHFTAVNGAAERGLTAGVSDDTYRPAADVRRDQMATFAVRLMDTVTAHVLSGPASR